MRKFLRQIICLLIDLIAKVEMVGYDNIPVNGGFVLAVNHLGFLDVPLALYTLDKWEPFILIADKWEKNPLWSWIGKYFNFVYIDRENPSLGTLREIIRRMEEGQILIIAPEGTRARDEKMAEGKPGVTYLAVKAGFPIFPVGVIGTEDRVIRENLKKFRRSPITLMGGKPFTLPPIPRGKREETLKEYTDEIMCRVAVLLPESSRGYYAEHPRLKELLGEV